MGVIKRRKCREDGNIFQRRYIDPFVPPHSKAKHVADLLDPHPLVFQVCTSFIQLAPPSLTKKIPQHVYLHQLNIRIAIW